MKTDHLKYRPLVDKHIFYHFCAEQFLSSIRKEGLKIGRMPWGTLDGGVKLIPGYQWLTSNPEFQQSWNEGSSLKYDRTECRITIILPVAVRFSLHKWTEFKDKNPLYETLSCYGDPENWYVFKGTVIPFWISDIKYKAHEYTAPQN